MTAGKGSNLMERPAENQTQVFAIRHGETEWSRSGRHTGTTDIPLTERGREAARKLEPILSRTEFNHVLSSPLSRARVTCELAGFGRLMEIDRDLVEWNYGEYEGLTPEAIEQRVPGWMIFTDGCPGGETPVQIGLRVDRLIAKIRRVPGQVALFAHGHLLRVLAARWLGFPPARGSHFLLDTSTLSILGYYREIPAVKRWNAAFADERATS